MRVAPGGPGRGGLSGEERRAFLEGLPFNPDPFQVAAFDALDAGNSVLVAVPTGAGKTVVAQYAIHLALSRGTKAFYTTPLKALSNQKYLELCELHGPHNVGLLTGDNSLNGDADVVVMTTEVLRNMIYSASPALERLEHVVLDEVHYLQNPYRGAVWEEVIVHAPPWVRLVCLSATVSNAQEVAAWLTTVRGETVAVVDERRPVALEQLYLVGDRGSEKAHLLPTFVDGEANPEAFSLDSASLAGRPRHPRTRSRLYRPQRAEVVERLSEEGMLPAIYFVFSRAGCEDAVKAWLETGTRLTTPEERSQIRALAEARTATLSDSDLRALDYGRWLTALEAGVASHHAGMVPAFKETVEACFASALVKVVFATETLSLGINMPARSVVIESLSKFSGERHEMLTPGEYTQLTGRAGRRGIDDIGYAVVTWSPWVSFAQVVALASARSYELTSSFRPNYNMTANLVQRYEPEEARHLLNLSFAQYRSDSETVQLEGRLEQLRANLADVLAAATCDRGDIWAYRRSDLRHSQRTAGGQGARHPRSAVAASLGKLRPGEVIEVGGVVVAVVASSRRRGGGARLAVIRGDGRKDVLGPSDFSAPPRVLATLPLPSPYDPSDAGFLRATARRLIESGLAGHDGGERPGGRRRDPLDDEQSGARMASGDPIASCPDLRRHLRAADRAERIEGEIGRLERRLSGRRRSLSGQLDRFLALLEEWGYVRGWSLTDKGHLLSALYHEQDLLVVECLDAGLLDDLEGPSLAALASAFTFEARARAQPEGQLAAGPELAERFSEIERIWRRLTQAEAAADLPTTRMPEPGFMGSAKAWASGRSLSRIMDRSGLSGGDFVRNVKQLADLLHQLGDLHDHPQTAAVAGRMAREIVRGVVAASSVLENGRGEA